MKKHRWRQLLLTLPLVGACDGTRSTDPTRSTGPAFYVIGSSDNGICGGSGVHQHSSGVDGTCYPNTAVIALTPDGGGTDGITVIQNAISNWMPLLQEASGFNVPTLVYAPSGGIPVEFPANMGAGDYCGGTPDGAGSITLTQYVPTVTCGGQRGTLEQVLTHEIAHLLGLNQQHGGSFARSSSLTSTSCTSYIPLGSGFGNLTTNVCYHEVETIIRARNGGYTYDEAFYSSPLAQSTDVTPRVTSVEAGSTKSFDVSNWYFKPSGSVARNVASLTWTSAIPARASIVSDGVVAGETAGVGQNPVIIRLRGETGSLPSGHQFWTPFRDRGDSISITVTAPTPPPPPPFKVDSIWAAEMPITTPGWNTVFANVVSAPGTPVAIRWIVTDSRTPTVADTMYYYGLQMDVDVDVGSYTLSFRARPQYGSTFGIEYYQDIPVCTEGEALRGGGGQNNKYGGGGSTNAIENCPGGGEN